jgi:hypothetical protein
MLNRKGNSGGGYLHATEPSSVANRTASKKIRGNGQQSPLFDLRERPRPASTENFYSEHEVLRMIDDLHAEKVSTAQTITPDPFMNLQGSMQLRAESQVLRLQKKIEDMKVALIALFPFTLG